jgi:hypothetical protein
MIKILGKAFIDLKKSIYSFIPDTVDENVKQLILNGALNYVDENSNLHDKVEFLVLPTCINFELNSYRQIYPYLNELENSDYSAYVDALRSVTNSVIDYVLTDKHESTFCLESLNSIISKGQSLRQTLEFCKDVEVLKFAHYARASFIASSFMRSTVSKGIFSEERLSEFWRGTNNLTSIMRNDAYALKLGEMKYEVFLERYGHLRPGTYNLESLTYQESPDKFLIPLIESAVPSTQIAFNLTEKERDLIDLNLKEIGISLNSEMFLNFVKNATAGREILKLKFTKTLSRCLDQIVEVGSRLGLSREELNHLNLEYILDLNDEVATHPNILDELKTIALINKQKFMFFSKIELPDFLSNKIKLNAFQVMKHQPSFPSKKNISAVLYKIISGEKFDIEDISGKLVGIENADPGYEFLFASSIAGLITAYGGPNSHMSIRCAELNLPGVIGVGSEAFSSLNTGDFVEINSLGLMYRVLG